jgi:hypothetical protein
VSITLPSSPAPGQEVWVYDATGHAGTNSITISGGTIGSSSSLAISTNYGKAILIADSSGNWEDWGANL